MAEARAKRDAQRGMPGFGALAGRDLLYLSRRRDEDDDPAVYLVEVGRRSSAPPGRTGRGRERLAGALRDWPFNPPWVDRYSPEWVPFVIGREKFEAQWTLAVHDPGRWD
ncbi:putative protein OS=Streptomyces griseomycini OX=66895 GN=FHS37_003412 PE=4 SV=1 [Streptomyces griseomycini]